MWREHAGLVDRQPIAVVLDLDLTVNARDPNVAQQPLGQGGAFPETERALFHGEEEVGAAIDDESALGHAGPPSGEN